MTIERHLGHLFYDMMQNSAEKDLEVSGHDIFAYLDPADIDPRFGGGCCDREDEMYSVAVIGTGVHGQGHLRYQLDAGGRIAGIYDVSERSMRTALRILPEPDSVTLYKSVSEACADPNVDAIIIATPNYTHREIFEEAVKYGKHILLEKPIAADLADAHAILEISKGYSGVILVGLEYRLKPMYMQAAHEVFSRNSLGDIKMISIMEHRPPFLNKAKQWNKFSIYSGGTLVEKCCHYFDQANFFAKSRPMRVFASGGQAVHYKDFTYEGQASDILDHAYVIVEYENDARAKLDLSMFSKDAHEEIVILGDRGRLHGIDGDPAEVRVETFQDMPESRQTLNWARSGGHSGSSPAQARLFASILTDKECVYPSVEDGFWAVAVGVAAEESVKRGLPVNIDELLCERGISI